ncbi:MAG: hypothetical protein ACM3X6_07420 [Patescibacteria group bacterium]
MPLYSSTTACRTARAKPSTARDNGHLAFVVPDVAAAREAVLAAGGRAVGGVVTTETGDGELITWAYLSDLEGNIIELQSRRKR